MPLDYRMGKPPILRKDMPKSKEGRSKCCLYGIIDPTGQKRDMICGLSTDRFWDDDAECWDWKPWCAFHKNQVDKEVEEPFE